LIIFICCEKTYNFYVDCLSTENNQCIPEKMLQKINEYLNKNKTIAKISRKNSKLINSLEKEINIDFERANNKTMFDVEVLLIKYLKIN